MMAKSSESVRKRPGKATIVACVVIAAVLVCAVAAASWMSAGSGDARLVAIVHDADGGQVELPLDQDVTKVIETSLGSNTVVVQDGSVHVSQADCDNHDCIRQGAISRPGQQIICLPHKLWIEVVPQGGSAGQMDVDAVPGGAQDHDELQDVDTVAR